jgi:beta-glucosidase
MGASGFPAGFLWGAACASHQVEGGNRWNDWWELEESGRLPHRSGDACRHYELYESDFDLARSLGHNAHRLSLEWSRIEPADGEWNEAALEHYRRVIAAARARGIEPCVTLHHFTSPAWFARGGGWERSDSVLRFTRYAEFVAARLSRDVRFWLTINEPTVLVKRAYLGGSWPPCRRGALLGGWRALRNLCRAHTAAYEVLHRHRPDAMVGFAHSAPHVVACDPHRALDRMAARARDFVLNDSCFRLFGRPPAEVLDFLGINYYAREVVTWRPVRLAMLFGTECREHHHGAPRRFSSLGWEIHPQGLRHVLERFAKIGVPLLVSENGIATDDESERVSYLEEHLAVLAQAIAAGSRVLGYLYWTLFDNYEWTEGFGAHFGLAARDPVTQRRDPRPAAWRLKSIIDANHATQMRAENHGNDKARGNC